MKNYKIVAYTLDGVCYYDTGFVYDLQEADRVVNNMIWLNKTLGLEESTYLIIEKK